MTKKARLITKVTTVARLGELASEGAQIAVDSEIVETVVQGSNETELQTRIESTKKALEAGLDTTKIRDKISIHMIVTHAVINIPEDWETM